MSHRTAGFLSIFLIASASAVQAQDSAGDDQPAPTPRPVAVEYSLFAVNTVTGVWNMWESRHRTLALTSDESKYEPNGTFMNGRATRNMDRLAVRVDAGSLVVDVDRMFQSDKDPAGWAAAATTI